MNCLACGSQNRDSARFCDECGARLESAQTRPRQEGERRQITVVFCDLIGSTKLSGQMDPEEFREIMDSYHDAASDVIRRLGGAVALFLGDGILTYFGYPEAHEDDVERAARAGLQIVQAVRALNEKNEGSGLPELAVRVAAHTGDAVVRDMDDGAGIYGETPNVAARLQSLAPPNGVVISGATHELVRGLFRVEDLGEHHLDGVQDPVRALVVHAPSGIRSRFVRRADLPPLVGREEELALLRSTWERAAVEAGRALIIHGEAGLGKSRLVAGFQDSLDATPHTWLECSGNPYAQGSAFAPVIQLQADALRFSAEESAEEKLSALSKAIERAGMDPQETVPYLAALHSIEIPKDSGFAPVQASGSSPEAIRRKTKEAARDWLLFVGRQQPVVLLVEDLHWMDPSSLELLGDIIADLGTTKVFLIMTARPHFEAPAWEAVATIHLDRLDNAQAKDLVHEVASPEILPSEQVDTIVQRTDGIPLFVEEMTRAAIDAGGSDSKDNVVLGVPATLKGLLMARIDQLGRAKDVVQIGATIGREFSDDLIRSVWKDDPNLDATLDHLSSVNLIDQVGRGPAFTPGQSGAGDARRTRTYVFKHALVQETAYEALLKTTRTRYHTLIAEALNKDFPETAETRPELVAHHFTQAGDWGSAVPLWQSAGQRSAERSANAEADRHLRSGIDCLSHLPEGPERFSQELIFRTRLGANLISVKGYGSDDVLENISRARALCEDLGNPPLLFPVLYNLWVFHLMRADPDTPAYADQMLAIAEESDPERMLMWAHVAQAITHYWQGHFHDAIRHAQICRQHYRSDPNHISLFGDDPGAYGFVYEGLPLWFTGFPDRAVERFDDALSIARSIGYAFTIAGAQAFYSQLQHFRRDLEGVAVRAQATIGISHEQQFPVFLGSGLAQAGWAAMKGGDLDGGFDQVQQGAGLYRATGAVLNTPYFQALLAEGHLLRGERAEGLAATDEGLTISANHLDGVFVSELHRLKGDLLGLEPNHHNQAWTAYEDAMRYADDAGALTLALRTSCSMARHLATAGRAEDARELVGSLLAQFTEGFESTDLKEAKTLLDELVV